MWSEWLLSAALLALLTLVFVAQQFEDDAAAELDAVAAHAGARHRHHHTTDLHDETRWLAPLWPLYVLLATCCVFLCARLVINRAAFRRDDEDDDGDGAPPPTAAREALRREAPMLAVNLSMVALLLAAALCAGARAGGALHSWRPALALVLAAELLWAAYYAAVRVAWLWRSDGGGGGGGATLATAYAFGCCRPLGAADVAVSETADLPPYMGDAYGDVPPDWRWLDAARGVVCALGYAAGVAATVAALAGAGAGALRVLVDVAVLALVLAAAVRLVGYVLARDALATVTVAVYMALALSVLLFVQLLPDVFAPATAHRVFAWLYAGLGLFALWTGVLALLRWRRPRLRTPV